MECGREGCVSFKMEINQKYHYELQNLAFSKPIKFKFGNLSICTVIYNRENI